MNQVVRAKPILIRFTEASRTSPFANDFRDQIFKKTKNILESHSLKVYENYGLESDTGSVTFTIGFDNTAASRDYGLFTNTSYYSTVVYTINAGGNPAIFEASIQKYHPGSLATFIFTVAGIGYAVIVDNQTSMPLIGMAGGVVLDFMAGGTTDESHWEDAMNEAIEQGLEQFLNENGLR